MIEVPYDFEPLARPQSVALDHILGYKFPILKLGYVSVVDYMGNENSIVDAAKRSYGRGTRTLRDDIALIRYLLRHYHNTPFEMCELTLSVDLPIFVARQWIRHRTANVNEYSARYSIVEEKFYIPDESQLLPQSKTNKQGRDETTQLSDENKKLIGKLITENNDDCFARYEKALALGLSRELARVVLPVNIHTNWTWKIDVSNLMKYLNLREDHHAQYEIRVYAEKISEILQLWMPNVHNAYISYIHKAVNLSKEQFEFLKNCLEGNVDTQYVYELFEKVGKPSDMSKREYDDLVNLFKEST